MKTGNPSHATLSRLLAFILPALALTGCASPGFRDAWQKAGTSPPPEDFSGPWEGTWTSEKTGHTGAVRCLVASTPDDDGLYDFHYWASWKKALTGEFHVRYPVNHVGDKYYFGGKHDLGKAFGGIFSHRGESTGSEFKATYSSAQDEGAFDMKRP